MKAMKAFSVWEANVKKTQGKQSNKIKRLGKSKGNLQKTEVELKAKGFV